MPSATAPSIGLAEVRAAAQRISRHIVRTPFERSAVLSEVVGTEVWLKYECFQLTGSFKLRGALNALLLLDARDVVTASAGNHGLGVARAAHLLGRTATVVVPETASPAKVEALRQSGAELIQVGPTYDEAELAAIQLSRDRGVPYVSAYNDAGVVAGGGTIALEVLEDVPEVRTFVVPAGGGGLISGVGVAAHGVNPEAHVYGVQSEASPALHAALVHGGLVPVDVHDSLADGLSGNVEAGSITFGLMQTHVKEVGLVSETAIANAMRWMLRNEHVLVEGSAAVGIAALLEHKLDVSGPVAVILTGRNVAPTVLSKLLLAEL